MYFACRSFIGKSSPQNWSQFWENEPDDPSLAICCGHLFGLLTLSLNPATEIQVNTLGHQLIESLNRAYFSADAKAPLNQLNSAIDSLLDQYRDQLKELTLILAVSLNQRLFLAVYNLGHVFLVRAGQSAQLLAGQANRRLTLSGPLQPYDKIFLCTEAFLNQLGWANIRGNLLESNLQTIEENFLSSLYRHQHLPDLASLLITIQPEAYEEVTPPSQLTKPPTDKSTPPPDVKTPRKSILNRLFSRPALFVGQRDSREIQKRKRWHLFLAIGLLLALTASSYLGYRKNQAARRLDRYQELKVQVDKKLADADKVKNLNLDSALKLAEESELLLNEMTSLQPSAAELPQYRTIVKNLLSQTGSSAAFNPDPFFDISILQSQPQYSKIIISSPRLYLLDTVSGRVDSLHLSERSNKNITTDSLVKSAKNIVAVSSTLYLQTADAVYLIGATSPEQKIDLKKISAASANFVDFQSWNGALYGLDSQNLTIWKFNPSASAFGDGQDWLKNTRLEGNPNSLAINGKIWVLNSSGNIFPYIRGQKDNFKQAVLDSITNPGNLITAADRELLAFSDGSLLYLLQKDGSLKAKYNLGDKKIIDIALDEDSSAIYILADDQKIYSIKIDK